MLGAGWGRYRYKDGKTLGAEAVKKDSWMRICFLLFLVTVSVWFSSILYQRAAAGYLRRVKPEGDQFRRMEVSEAGVERLIGLEKETGMAMGELLTVLLPFESQRFYGNAFGAEDFVKWKRIMLRNNRQEFERIRGIYGAVWDDVRCFPVAAEGVRYENSWMFERSYGGKRGHEGTDLMPEENIPGHYRVVSMTEGVVEKIGWLPKGGYRIGIRSPSGGYFYYAHLDSYSREYQIGEEVKAGEVLGLMGDTGYGEEGTRGKFDVHLHLGIYIATEEIPELSINPYWVLQYQEAEKAAAE